MNKETPHLTKLLPKFILYSALVIVVVFPSLTEANSLGITAKISLSDLAYFRVYRAQPGWWLGPHRSYGAACRKSCVYNKYGSLVRCQKTCAY